MTTIQFSEMSNISGGSLFYDLGVAIKDGLSYVVGYIAGYGKGEEAAAADMCVVYPESDTPETP